MRILATILLTFSLGATLPAQTLVSAEQSPYVDVLTFKWGVINRTTFYQSPGYGADASRPQDDRNRKEPVTEVERSTSGMDRRPGDSSRSYPGGPRQRRVEQTVTRFETYAHVKNTGDKRIKAISWRYVFYDDRDCQKEVKRYSFRSKADILPGEERNLIKQVVDRAPTDHQRVLIDQVEYSDGSKWQRPGSK